MMERSSGKQTSGGDLRVVLPLMVLVFTLWLVKLYWDRRHFFRMASRIPNAGKKPLLGVALDLLRKSMEESFETILSFFRTSPEIFKLWFGPNLVVGFSRPEHIKIIQTNPNSLSKSTLVEFAKGFMGNGLLTAPVDTWKRHRKLINPVFNQKALNSFVPIFSEQCEILVGILEKHAGQKDANILEKLSRCVLDSICDSAMGLKVETQSSPHQFGRLLDKAMEMIMLRILNVFHHPQIIYDMSPEGKTFRKVVSELNEFTHKVLAERRAEFELKLSGDYIEEKGEHHIKSFLELLLEMSHNGNQFTDQEIQDEINTFVAAGTDTSSVALAFCTMMSGMFPEYQQKVYEEAIEVLGQDRYPTQEDLPKLKFTEMFIKETLRIFPIAPLLLRVAFDDIEIGDLTIPKGSLLLSGILQMHRNPEFWEDPLRFDPYRFLPEEFAKKHPYSYLPFSGGPRNCYGHKFALTFMKVTLSSMVRKFEFKTEYKSVEEVQLKINLVTRPSDGFKVTFEQRE